MIFHNGSQKKALSQYKRKRLNLFLHSLSSWDLDMIQHVREEDRAILMLLPLLVYFINSDENLKESEIRSLAKLHPREFEYIAKTPIAEILSSFERYRGHRIYRDLIGVILSDQGRKWIEVNAKSFREYRARKS